MAIKKLVGKASKERMKTRKSIKEMEDWSTMTPSKAGKYIDKNVKELKDVKTVLKEMAKLLIHLRDLNLK